ncbi:MAG TPA: hypothetical protein PLE75_08760 [Ferruginibacter sp.]|nr:hypothetical protein [Ferruginibacter sp.]HRO06760.1 hypothetical protein [Ferruginibacter sp.]HRO97157.1 hypothetical protein [Ferruginibacter sp.]HRP49613.1 hypothetical protein [Ferruginibacter sp.]
MRKHEPKSYSLSNVLKAVADAFNRLFFTDDNRDFQRLKNFIAS